MQGSEEHPAVGVGPSRAPQTPAVSLLGVRACWWVPFGGEGAGAGPPSPLLLGQEPGPRGQATAQLHFGNGLGKAAGRGRFSFPSALPWGGPICSAVSSAGLPSSRKMRSYWRESSGGLRG